jgi:hypothetical protein
MERELIEAYANGPALLARLVSDLSADEMRRQPPADLNIGRWSIHQILIHLADAEAVLADRMKRVIAEENPVLLAFDENKWAAMLEYERQSAEDAWMMISLIRRQMSRVLWALPEAAFARFGTHSEAGKKTLADLVGGAQKHLLHHAAFIEKKRKWVGK